MKKIFLCLALSICSLCNEAFAKDAKPVKVVDSPEIKINNTGVVSLKRAEFFKDSTRLSFEAKYIPGNWINVDTNFVMEIHGETLQPIASAGIVLGERFVMPESGRHSFSLTYPAIKGKLSTMDLIERGGSWRIYGIRLDGKKYPQPSAEKWLKANRAEYKGAPDSMIYTSPKSSVFKGIVVGYDPRVHDKNFLMYDEDMILGLDKPLTVPIAEDGSFETQLSMRMPKHILTTLGDQDFGHIFYFEPGKNLAAFIDLKTPDDDSKNQIKYGDELGIINSQLAEAPEFWGYRCIPEIKAATLLDETVSLIEARRDSFLNLRDEFISIDDIHPRVKEIVIAQEKAAMLQLLLDRQMGLRSYSKRTKNPMPAEPEVFYQYIKEYSTDSVLPLTSPFSVLLNRLQFSTNFARRLNLKDKVPYIVDSKPFTYIKELGAVLNDQEEQLCKTLEEHDGEEVWLTNDSIANISTYIYQAAKRNGVYDQHSQQIDSLRKEAFALSPSQKTRALVRNLVNEKNAIAEFFGTEDAPLWWQMTVANKITASRMKPTDIDQSEAFDAIAKLEENGVLTDKCVKSAVRDYYLTAYKPFDLPDNEAGDLVRKMIAPHKGKFILMDLWATTCGPCRGAIEDSKDFRERNLHNPDFAAIFVTDESLSPRQDYDAFVAENFIGEDTHYLGNYEFNLLRELFGFNAIPRYVMFDREGNVVSKSFPGYYTIKSFLKKNGATVK